jgi:hypothetical protein
MVDNLGDPVLRLCQGFAHSGFARRIRPIEQGGFLLIEGGFQIFQLRQDVLRLGVQDVGLQRARRKCNASPPALPPVSVAFAAFGIARPDRPVRRQKPSLVSLSPDRCHTGNFAAPAHECG